MLEAKPEGFFEKGNLSVEFQHRKRNLNPTERDCMTTNYSYPNGMLLCKSSRSIHDERNAMAMYLNHSALLLPLIPFIIVNLRVLKVAPRASAQHRSRCKCRATRYFFSILIIEK